LGFGAKVEDNPHKAICGLVGRPRFEALQNMTEFRHINEDMKLIRSTILSHFDDSQEFHGRTFQAVDPLTNKKRTPDQKLAWIYQALETSAVTQFAQAMRDEGHEPVLWVHDCLYFADRLPLSLYQDAQERLRAQFPLLRIDYTGIWPIGLDSDYEALTIAQAAMEAEHRQAIVEEELRAGKDMTDPQGFDPLDIDRGYFAEEIKALNPEQKRGLGTSVKLPN
jgi:hypothetical protein